MPDRRSHMENRWLAMLDGLDASLGESNDCSLTVYGHPVSVTTCQVLTLLAEKGQSPEFRVVDVMSREHKDAEHLGRHPFGLLPVLDHGGFVLYETHAILRYIDAAIPGPALTPEDVRTRARMDQWLSVEHAYLHPAVKKCLARGYAEMMGLDDPGAAIVEEGRREVGQVLDLFERELAKGQTFESDDFSLADLCWLTDFHQMGTLGLRDLIEDRPDVDRWFCKNAERSAWRKVLTVLEVDPT